MILIYFGAFCFNSNDATFLQDTLLIIQIAYFKMGVLVFLTFEEVEVDFRKKCQQFKFLLDDLLPCHLLLYHICEGLVNCQNFPGSALDHDQPLVILFDFVHEADNDEGTLGSIDGMEGKGSLDEVTLTADGSDHLVVYDVGVGLQKVLRIIHVDIGCNMLPPDEVGDEAVVKFSVHLRHDSSYVFVQYRLLLKP